MRSTARPIQWFKDHPAIHQWGLTLLLLAVYAYIYERLAGSSTIPVGVLIIIPVMVSVWLNGKYAWITFGLGLIIQTVISLQKGLTFNELAFVRGGILGMFVVLVVLIVLLHLRRTTRGLRKQAADQQNLLAELHQQTAFLTLLGDIIGTALEAADLTSMLQVLVNRTGELFGAHDCYITFWDEDTRQTIPQVAYGSLSESYLQVHQFQNGEYTLTAAVMDAGHAIAIENMEATDAISKNVAEEFPNKAALGLPLIAGKRKLGTLILGFNERHAFTPDEITRGELAARQISLAITKVILLEEERKSTRQLDTLLALAIESTTARNEEELILSATRLIGEKLYPDNFGIMMLDESAGMLRVHPSYYTPGVKSPDIPVGQGVTGYVAQSGQPCRVDDVRHFQNYISVDPQVRSELCVPLKLGEKVVGVVNAENKKPNAFSEDDENLLTIMAGQLVTAMGRLRSDKDSYRHAVQLFRASSLIKLLAEVGTRATLAADPDRVLQTLGAGLEQLDLRCLVSLLSDDGKELTIRYTSIPAPIVRVAERFAREKLYDHRIPLEQVGSVLSDLREPAWIHNPVDVAENLLPGLSKKLLRRIFMPGDLKTELPVCILPLKTEGGPLGYLWMWGKELQESDMNTMTVFAYQIASALQNAHLLVRVQRLAVTDELTGLFNRRYFFDIAGKEFERAVHGHTHLSILIIDMDHFKKFNDNYGHLVGDQVLRGAARLMRACVRARDVIGRYGGEEFSIALPGTDSRDAVHIAQRFLDKVGDTPIPTDAGELHVHISVGVASLKNDEQNLNDLINRADQAMYEAKGKGGDQFAVH